jgi:hypothetical protein
MLASHLPGRQWPLAIVVFGMVVCGGAIDRAYGQRFHGPLVGDINLDGHVDARDVAAMEYVFTNPIVLFQEYVESHGLTLSQANFVADVNGDGVISNLDVQSLISLVANNAASSGGQLTAVPEPATQTLSVIGASVLAMWRLRRRMSLKTSTTSRATVSSTC